MDVNINYKMSYVELTKIVGGANNLIIPVAKTPCGASLSLRAEKTYITH